MNTGKIVAITSLLGSLVALSPLVVAADNFDITTAAQNATTPRDHETVAKYYEDAARGMQAKIQEKKELLEQYEDKSYLYGRQAQDLQAHTDALVHRYEKLANELIREANLHREMALQVEEGKYSASSLPRLHANQTSSRPGL